MSFYDAEFNIEFGITNLGSTCYQNAIYQALMRFEPIQKFLFKNVISDNKISPLSKHILSNFIRWLIFYMFSARGGKYEKPKKIMISTFKKCSFDRKFTDNTQQDATELLTYLLDTLNNNSKNYIAKNISINSTHEITCIACGEKKEYVAINNEMLLTTLFTDGNKMDEMVKNINSNFVFEAFCKKCNKGDAKWKGSPAKIIFSDFLIIFIKRFGCDRATRVSYKIRDDVTMKCHLKVGALTYSLISIVVHMGDVGGGHYIMHTRMGNKWITINDSSTSDVKIPTDPDEEFKSDGYVFFYKKLH